MRTEESKLNSIIRKEIFLVLNAVFIVVINIYMDILLHIMSLIYVMITISSTITVQNRC